MIDNLKMINNMENEMNYDNCRIHDHQNLKQIGLDLQSTLMNALVMVLLLLTFSAVSAAPMTAAFTTANDASDMLYKAVDERDKTLTKKLFGIDNLYLLPLDEVDEQDRVHFINSWKKSHKLTAGEKDEMFISVGTEGWTFPIPLRKTVDGWHFDTISGIEVIKTRRIGRNELSTIQAVLAYFDAQKEYAEKDRNGNGVLEYAQRFISTPGNKDGLFWTVKPGEASSPLGAFFADNTPERAYHGYYYKILKEQGEHARGGNYSYMMGDYMKSGFALVAWPAEYDDSGIMSFIINHDGVLFEKNLGPDALAMVTEMSSFDPGDGWIRSEEVDTAN